MRAWARILCAAVAASTLSVGVAAPAAAQDDTVQDDTVQNDSSPEQQLAERYAPVVFVRPQSGPCDANGERFEPAPVDIVLGNDEVFLRQVGNDDPVLMNGPTAADIFDLREGWYLDFPGDALEPGCVFEQDFRRFYDGQPVVYAHVTTEAERPGWIALQYWFFWYHNPSKNDHEGDWEFVQLLFEADSVEQALSGEPSDVGYAQHTGGERARWGDSKLETIDGRPVVYPAMASHASYYGQALYLGRSGREGFGCDNTDGASKRIDPAVVLLPDEVTDRDDPLAWLAFLGRWGQRESGFFNGPTGPFEKARWTQPVTWHEGLRDSSVVIPGGDRTGDSVVKTFCGAVERGSSALVFALRSPVVAMGVALVLLALSTMLASRTRWAPVATKPLRDHRAIGQIIRAALRVWRDHPWAMAWVGLVYVPVSLLTSAVQILIQNLPLVDHLIDLAGDHSAMAFLFAVFVGGFGNLLAFAYVSAVVATTIDRGEFDHSRLIGLDLDTVRVLVATVFRGAVIVVALLLSIIGIPWAIRQLVRYQLAPQAIVLEGAVPRQALRRSSQLVSGHWWWTAIVIAAVQLTIAIAGIGSALLILVTVTTIPLWLFNVLSSLIYVLLVPVAGAAMAYVYGSLSVAGQGERIESGEQPLEPAPA